MLAARDQENLAFSHHAGAVAKQQQNQGIRQLQPKTPGARYPKTPLKIPLNDENANHGLGKSVLGGRSRGANENIMTIGKGGKAAEKSNWVTPLEPRTTRAPLGNKTTNAKARTVQAPGVKDIVREIEKTSQPMTVKKAQSSAPKADASKLVVLNDPLNDEEEDIEYCPPRPKDIPYESDIFPDGVLNFDVLKPENRIKGYYDYYHNSVDDNGMTRIERQMHESQQRAFKKLDEQVKKDLDEMDWSVRDVPASKHVLKKQAASLGGQSTGTGARKQSRLVAKPPPTIASRKAASALSMATKTSAAQPRIKAKPEMVPARGPLSLLGAKKPLSQQAPAKPTSTENSGALAASRSTLGYTKGRSASSMVHGRKPQTTIAPLPRSFSTASTGSDTTITPERYAEGQRTSESEDWRRLEFLSIFDGEDDDDGQLGSDLPMDDLEENFEFKVNF